MTTARVRATLMTGSKVRGHSMPQKASVGWERVHLGHSYLAPDSQKALLTAHTTAAHGPVKSIKSLL